MLSLLLCSFTVTASDQFPISNADGSLTIGPLERAEDISTARARLENNGIPYRVEDTAAKESLGFIVVTREYTNKSTASDDLRGLADSGIKDYLYVGRGEYVNRISVGVFGNQDAAQNRAAKLNKLGFSFSVIERFRRTGTVSRIIVREPGLGIAELERIFLDQVAKDEPTQNNDSAEPAGNDIRDVQVPHLDEGELRVEKDFAEPIPEPSAEKETIPAPDDLKPVAEIPASTVPPSDVTPAIRYQPPAKDSGWLWYLFAGLALIIAGALAYFYQQQRSRSEWSPQPQAGSPLKWRLKPQGKIGSRLPQHRSHQLNKLYSITPKRYWKEGAMTVPAKA